MFDLITYRFQRLWKVMVLGCLCPVATVLVLQNQLGTDLPGMLLAALLVPIAHVLRYPQQWLETCTVSLILSGCLAYVAGLPADLPPEQRVLQYLLIGTGALAGFVLLIVPILNIHKLGPTRRMSFTSSAVSTLDVETLKTRITHYPGRTDALAECSAADAEGRFEVHYPIAGFHQFRYEMPGGPRLDEIEDWDLTQKTHTHYSAVVSSSGEFHHEIMCFGGDVERFSAEDASVTVLRYDFAPLPDGGTRVTLTETGILAPITQSFGFWLEDFGADWLTFEIDAAEGRAPRANRAFRVRQLIVDLGNIIAPLLGATRVHPPTD